MKQSRPLNENPGCLSIFKRSKQSGDTGNNPSKSSPYSVQDQLLTPAEVNFYLQACEVLSDLYVICPQVSLTAILKVNAKDSKTWQSNFNRISRKRVDFAVCEAGTMKVLYAIELDDSSHDRPDRQQRDEFLDRAFKAADLPLLHVDCRNAYSHQEMIEILFEPLRPKPAVPPPVPAAPPEPVSEPQKKKGFSLSGKKTAKPQPENLVICPTCGAPMKKRKVTQGAHQGEIYTVCSNYPKCPTFYPTGERAK